MSDGLEPTDARPLIEQAQYREVLGHFASGVVIVTGAAGEGSGPAALTCQSFFAVSLDPPLVALSPSRTSKSWPAIEASGAFCANVLASTQESLCRAFASSGGDKFAGVGWSGGVTGAPRLHDALAWIDCSIESTQEAGDHLLVLGRVHSLELGRGEPLLFYRGGFGQFRS